MFAIADFTFTKAEERLVDDAEQGDEDVYEDHLYNPTARERNDGG